MNNEYHLTKFNSFHIHKSNKNLMWILNWNVRLFSHFENEQIVSSKQSSSLNLNELAIGRTATGIGLTWADINFTHQLSDLIKLIYIVY